MEPIRPTSPPARHWRIIAPVSLGIVLLLTSLVVAAISLDAPSRSSSAPTTPASTSVDGQRWYSLGYVDIEGGVTPLYPLQPGRVKSIEVKENELVKAGAALFHLEDTVPLLKVRQAESDLRGAKAKLQIAEAQLEQAKRQSVAQKIALDAAKKNVERATLLFNKKKDFLKRGVEGNEETVKEAEISVEQANLAVKGEEQKLALAESATSIAERNVALAKENIKGKQAQLDEAKNAVQECVVRAPVDGMALRILVNVGQSLGTNPRQPAIQFAANRPPLVRAEVEQEFVGQVHPDQRVVIQDHVTGQECARGKVASIAHWYAPRRNVASELLSMNGDVRTLECIISIESMKNDIRIGQRVRVQFPE